ncbi:hypothetical protein PRNP1_013476 [Phytophthora ramorum]
MGRGPSLTGAERERIKSMWIAGDSLRDITKTLKRSYDTVHRVLEGPPSSKRHGAPRRLSEQQVEELAQVATAEKLTAKQLKDKFGYECSTRTIQRALVKHTGHKRQRDEDDSWSSKAENSCAPIATSGDEGGDAHSRVEEEQTQTPRSAAVVGDAAVVVEQNSMLIGSEEPSTSNSLRDRSSAASVSSWSGGSADAAIPRPAAALPASPTTSTRPKDSRRLELAEIIHAQNELLDGVIVQLDRQSTTMEVLLRHLLNQETQRAVDNNDE